jgi:dTDP-4-amino-4,6-dideoxygalactose transaminase
MNKINVTQTFLPSQEEFHSILGKVWQSKWITNRGVLVQELEKKIKKFLGVEFLTLTANGTLPLQIAIKSLELKGEIITTPFSYIASTSTIIWENCKPVFVDIDESYLTIDETKIEKAITNKTSAILATHVFGNPCNVIAIEKIAKKYNLKVIYDGAHCFGVNYKGKSIFNYGDISTCSFHATKIFHTGEGGCWVTTDKKLQEKIYYHHNFGHDGPESFLGLGINAKMSELHAAMGLSVFNYLKPIFEGRKKNVGIYNDLLGSSIKTIKIRKGTDWNYHYYPIIFETEESLLNALKKLNVENIFPRRYFYPSLNKINYINGDVMPISESVAERVLCLPLYTGLEKESIVKICNIIIKNI